MGLSRTLKGLRSFFPRRFKSWPATPAGMLVHGTRLPGQKQRTLLLQWHFYQSPSPIPKGRRKRAAGYLHIQWGVLQRRKLQLSYLKSCKMGNKPTWLLPRKRHYLLHWTGNKFALCNRETYSIFQGCLLFIFKKTLWKNSIHETCRNTRDPWRIVFQKFPFIPYFYTVLVFGKFSYEPWLGS